MENTTNIDHAGYVAEASEVDAPTALESWEAGVENVMEKAWDEMQAVYDEQGHRVIGAAVVLVHEDGSMTLATGGVGPTSEVKLGLGTALGQARTRLLAEAILARKGEDLAFMLDVALASRQR
jgi:hypothetical protein